MRPNSASESDSVPEKCLQTQREAIAEEQHFADFAYANLDRQIAGYTKQLERTRGRGASGTPAARSERDSFAGHYEDNITRLKTVENRLILGSLEFDSGSRTHIGRTTLRDPRQNIILTDWRAPQCEAFYRATPVDRQGVTRRRHIQTRFRTVVGVEDELLNTSSKTAEALPLTGEGALFAAMNRARDGRMGDIVSTIQAEQDRIIRSPLQGILVVQGGPGTGKTAVALHRAAYLLYTFRAQLENSGVLIIGPSPQFLRYIERVLPSLGESGVVSRTVFELLPGIRADHTDGEEAAALKGNGIWKKICARAVRQILQRPLTHAVAFRVSGKTVSLRPHEVARAAERARRSGKPHNEARNIYAKTLVTLLAEKLAARLETDLKSHEWIYTDIASDPQIRREINLHWLPASPLWLLEHILARPALFAQIAPELSPRQRELLYRAKGSGISRADIAILDELAMHLGPLTDNCEQRRRELAAAEEKNLDDYIGDTMSAMGLGGGIVSARTIAQRHRPTDRYTSTAQRAAEDRSWTYGHVVVDEAQELTEMQWRMIFRRNPKHSMTVVGDLDQRTAGAPKGGWQDLLGGKDHSLSVQKLSVSYRTPATILNYAAQKMRGLGIAVEPIRAARDIPNSLREITADPEADLSALRKTVKDTVAGQLRYLDGEYGTGLGTVAVIAPKSLSGQLKFPSSDARVRFVTPQGAKGLEYDVVILLGEKEIAENAPGDLYVALTRATRHLVIIRRRAGHTRGQSG